MINKNEQMLEATMNSLKERGVVIEEIAELVVEVQKPYVPQLTLSEALDHVYAVLKKREVQNAVLTGLFLDTAAEKGYPDEPLKSLLKTDDPLYGIDEILALSIVNIYGSIGLTNFGYLDKKKPGVIGKINKEKKGKVNTYLDDIVAAIVAATASRLAHRNGDDEYIGD